MYTVIDYAYLNHKMIDTLRQKTSSESPKRSWQL